MLQLFPDSGRQAPLRGLYLDESLRPCGTPAQPFVYASFVASLDGRISLPDPVTGTHKPPPAITNARDWRLVQELAASADVILTSGRYIRDLAGGDAQSDVPVSTGPEFADLLEWRNARGLAPQPAIAIVTRSLDLPIPEHLLESERPIYVATGEAENRRTEALRGKGVRILQCGEDGVEGDALIAALAREGFGNIDMTAGAALLHTLLAAHAFDRLYLTQAYCFLGGRSFETMLKGPALDPPIEFTLRASFFDAAGDDRAGQLFSVLDCRGGA
ncbi:MAG: RibD family protein [Gammaproteobacteria bacterium]